MYYYFRPECPLYNYIDEGRPIYIDISYGLREWLAFDIVTTEVLEKTLGNYVTYYK